MDIVYLLVPLSVVLVFAIVVMFWWSVHNGQFDDIERHGRSVIDDTDTPDTPGSAPGEPPAAPGAPPRDATRP